MLLVHTCRCTFYVFVYFNCVSRFAHRPLERFCKEMKVNVSCQMTLLESFVNIDKLSK